jgi:hypothetical protein
MNATFLLTLLSVTGTFILPSIANPAPAKPTQKFEVRVRLTEPVRRISRALLLDQDLIGKSQ